MKLKITPIDESKEIEGAQVKYHGVTLKIARAQSDGFVKEFKRLTRDVDFDTVDFGSNEIAEATMKAMAKHVLVGWSGIVIDGNEIEYSEENAYNLLKNDKDAREFISAYSQKVSNYFEEKKESLLGE